jgi:hypothetical protein
MSVLACVALMSLLARAFKASAFRGRSVLINRNQKTLLVPVWGGWGGNIVLQVDSGATYGQIQTQHMPKESSPIFLGSSYSCRIIPETVGLYDARKILDHPDDPTMWYYEDLEKL